MFIFEWPFKTGFTVVLKNDFRKKISLVPKCLSIHLNAFDSILQLNGFSYPSSK